MSGNFSIEVDPERDFVLMRMAGFFTPETVAALMAAREEAFGALRCAANAHVSLTDIREMKIQSQDMVVAFQTLLARADRFRSRRLAFVVASSLARMQLVRAVGSRSARFFTDEDEARAWLFSAEDDLAA